MDQQDVEILEHRTLYQGFFRIDGYRLRHRKFDGGWTDAMKRECFERGNAVAVLLYDPHRDAVVLVEQFRMGALAAGLGPWLVEVVAGIVDPGETQEEVARREAVEEADCPIRRLEKLYEFFPSPGGSSERVIMFVGEVDSAEAGGFHGLAHEHEDIKVHVMPVAEAIRRLDEDGYGNSIAIIALNWLARHHESLRRRWLESP